MCSNSSLVSNRKLIVGDTCDRSHHADRHESNGYHSKFHQTPCIEAKRNFGEEKCGGEDRDIQFVDFLRRGGRKLSLLHGGFL